MIDHGCIHDLPSRSFFFYSWDTLRTRDRSTFSNELDEVVSMIIDHLPKKYSYRQKKRTYRYPTTHHCLNLPSTQDCNEWAADNEPTTCTSRHTKCWALISVRLRNRSALYASGWRSSFPCFSPLYSMMKISYIHLAPATHCQGYLVCIRALDSTSPPLSQLLERTNPNVLRARAVWGLGKVLEQGKIAVGEDRGICP